MQRYFVKAQSFQKERVKIDGEDAHHITRVMRMETGNKVICSDGERTALCELEEVTNDRVVGKILEWLVESSELPNSVTIAQGMPKADKLDFIVQKGTELGASNFLPFVAERSVVKWPKEKTQKKVARLERIAKEAAEQSHRQKIPVIEGPISFYQLVEQSSGYDIRIVAYEEEAKKKSSLLANVLSETKPGQSILLVIGPEGGLSEKEIHLLRENNFHICGLGPRILRTETASLYLLSTISYETELMR